MSRVTIRRTRFASCLTRRLFKPDHEAELFIRECMSWGISRYKKVDCPSSFLQLTTLITRNTTTSTSITPSLQDSDISFNMNSLSLIVLFFGA